MPPTKVLLLAAASDVVAGLVLAVIGLGIEEQVLTIVGAALALGGASVLAWLVVRSSRPEQL